MRILVIVLLLGFLGASNAVAQTEFQLNFSDPDLTDGKIISLQAFEHRPAVWNGKVMLMNHGSTDGKIPIREPIKYLNIAKYAKDNGYIMVAFMRKGRGLSEGIYTEEYGRCDYHSISIEQGEALSQLDQVVDQIKKRYSVQQLVLMGHSRGGLLVAKYAELHPENVSAVVNMAGVWSAQCEPKNGGLSRRVLESSAKAFKNQYWLYFERDSYFDRDKFNDPDYSWLSEIAAQNGLVFRRFRDEGMPDGHLAPTWRPETWTKEIFPLLNEAK